MKKRFIVARDIIMPGMRIFMRETVRQIFRRIFYFRSINEQMFDNNFVTHFIYVCRINNAANVYKKRKISRGGAGINFLSLYDFGRIPNAPAFVRII